jgi:hypothetical protein
VRGNSPGDGNRLGVGFHTVLPCISRCTSPIHFNIWEVKLRNMEHAVPGSLLRLHLLTPVSEFSGSLSLCRSRRGSWEWGFPVSPDAMLPLKPITLCCPRHTTSLIPLPGVCHEKKQTDLGVNSNPPPVGEPAIAPFSAVNLLTCGTHLVLDQVKGKFWPPSLG